MTKSEIFHVEKKTFAPFTFARASSFLIGIFLFGKNLPILCFELSVTNRISLLSRLKKFSTELVFALAPIAIIFLLCFLSLFIFLINFIFLFLDYFEKV